MIKAPFISCLCYKYKYTRNVVGRALNVHRTMLAHKHEEHIIVFGLEASPKGQLISE